MLIAWKNAVSTLKQEISNSEYLMWVSKVKFINDSTGKQIIAPNKFIMERFAQKYLPKVIEIILKSQKVDFSDLKFIVQKQTNKKFLTNRINVIEKDDNQKKFQQSELIFEEKINNIQNFQKDELNLPKNTNHPRIRNSLMNNKGKGDLNKKFNFDTFIKGDSNRFARNAAFSVAQNPQDGHNPLVIYGGVGLGKTHLMQAIGNYWLKHNPDIQISYINAQRFVQEMVEASRNGKIEDFQKKYRFVDAFLVDDIQFLAGKVKSQEEFFYVFNSLTETGRSVILTCDRHPKDIETLEERLKSRLNWGLILSIDPPDLQTRVAIVNQKMQIAKVNISKETSLYLAQKIKSNIRELEGAIKRILAHSHFLNQPIDISLINESLKDLFAVQDKNITLENIQKVVAEYYSISVSDLQSKSRVRSIARPRQIAMMVAKEITEQSVTMIGASFGKRDHSTVLHACKKIKELRKSILSVNDDYNNIIRILTS